MDKRTDMQEAYQDGRTENKKK